MATYYGTYGQKVQYLASDPSDPQIGQVWYNSTSATLKVRQEVSVNAWASGGNLNTARGGLGSSGSGTQTAALAFGGFNGTANVGNTESYNGTSWTTVPATTNTTTRYMGSSGTQTAALKFGGGPPAITATESYNGSAWTSVNSLGTARYQLGGVGLQTASLAFGGGITPPGAVVGNTELWNGTSWTANPTGLNTARNALGNAGSQTAALGFGGLDATPANTGATESWNGTSWTSLPATMNTVRNTLGGTGSQTAALGFGGSTGTASELWNGTSWTSLPNIATSRYGVYGSGTQTSSVIFGGFLNGPNAATAATEEWTGIETQTKTVTVS